MYKQDLFTFYLQDAGTEVVKAKAGAGSATLSMAYAAARFDCLAASQPVLHRPRMNVASSV